MNEGHEKRGETVTGDTSVILSFHTLFEDITLNKRGHVERTQSVWRPLHPRLRPGVRGGGHRADRPAGGAAAARAGAGTWRSGGAGVRRERSSACSDQRPPCRRRRRSCCKTRLRSRWASVCCRASRRGGCGGFSCGGGGDGATTDSGSTPRASQDASERCRQLAAETVLLLVQRAPVSVLSLLPYAVPVLHERLVRAPSSATAPPEPSEARAAAGAGATQLHRR